MTRRRRRTSALRDSPARIRRSARVPLAADFFRQPRGVAGGAHVREGPLSLAQEARAGASIAEIYGQACSFLAQEGYLGARARLDDERLGARQARLDCDPRR